ncbi:MAG: glutamate synthase large subunit [Myxococcota bacterium]
MKNVQDAPGRRGLYDPAFEHDACGVGFVVNVQGEPSHEIIRKGVEILANLTHRGASGQDPETGDGAGLLLQLPHRFLRKVAREGGFTLPEPGRFGVGTLFLSGDADVRDWQMRTMEEAVAGEDLGFLGWRDVPVDADALGWLARERLPTIRQLFVDGAGLEGLDLERKLYITRRVAENRARERGGEAWRRFHLPSLSSRIIVYKGLLLSQQIEAFYPDLADPELESALALVHQRYSTNTFPTWDLAQPFRFLAHNGEINTLRGNANWMLARQRSMDSEAFGEELQKLLPVLREDASDSFQLDNALELLVLSGRSIAHAICMLIPEAWQMHEHMSPERRAFYEYHYNLLEPWDGPASIAFTDGTRVGAVLDRNGLRPSRFVETKDGFVVMASEVGVLQVEPDNVARKGRLEPGRIFLVDTEAGRIVADEEIKDELIRRQPYREWLDEHILRLHDLPRAGALAEPAPDERIRLQKAFAYTVEDERILLQPMIATGKEAIGSMGDDTALACLSDRPRLLFDYFKQQFAQVTNPPIDSIRERLVMSLRTTFGPSWNLLDERPQYARVIELRHPLLTNDEVATLQALERDDFQSRTLPMVFEPGGGRSLESALERLGRQASEAVAEGATLLFLSDRHVGPGRVPIPSLLATAAVQAHLTREGTRTACNLIVETGEAREVGHFALLVGFGATAVNPYLAYATIDGMLEDGTFLPEDLTRDRAHRNYFKAVNKGLLKILAKMGISTLQSYRGARIFEAVGLSDEVVERYFSGTPSRVSGVDLDVIAREAEVRHERGFPSRGEVDPELDAGGQYQWRRRGERHVLNPDTIAKLQHAVQFDDFERFGRFSDAVDDAERNLCTLRGLFDLDLADEPVPLDEVEPASEIVKRFCTGAMSFGSISAEAHETLAIAMNRLGGRSNSGEGGEDPFRYIPDDNGDLRRSAIKQVASGRFGVTSWYLTNGDELQIKMAQGAKPGEGGQLPGHKVSPEIASIRHSTEGVGLISPPPHHDIYSIEDLAQLIHDLKCANPKANVSVKLVSESGVGTVAAGVAKGKADNILVSGYDGGTGASPQTSIKSAGVPWEIGLAETQQTLVMNNLRGRVRLQVDGGLRTGRDVVIGALLGADEFGFSSAPLVAMGCIMMRVCHLNTCPVGIATQDERLRRRFEGTVEHVVRYFTFLAEEVRVWMSKLGFRRFDDMVGRVERLGIDEGVRSKHWKAKGLDFSDLLYKPDVPHPIRHCETQDHGLEEALDNELIERARPALEDGERVEMDLPIRNIHRTVGTMLGSEVSRRYASEGLPEDTITIRFSGSTGQSFGAWLPHGITMVVSGDANDYIGKGLCGGKIAVRVPEGSDFEPGENIIVGNVALYGATSGTAYFNGRAGERFCVRNSGANAVVEGIGDHGCEYMTGGHVVVLGPVGRNFAAGMSGGVAYVLDEAGAFEDHCNTAMVLLEEMKPQDDKLVRRLLTNHRKWTGSAKAAEVLDGWDAARARFVKVMPVDYKRALGARIGAESGNE